MPGLPFNTITDAVTALQKRQVPVSQIPQTRQFIQDRYDQLRQQGFLGATAKRILRSLAQTAGIGERSHAGASSKAHSNGRGSGWRANLRSGSDSQSNDATAKPGRKCAVESSHRNGPIWRAHASPASPRRSFLQNSVSLRRPIVD